MDGLALYLCQWRQTAMHNMQTALKYKHQTTKGKMMAYLLELLSENIKEWPNSAEYIAQGRSGKLYNQEYDVVGFIEEIAEDRDFSRVTRFQWETERARIATNQQATQEAREIAQGDGKRSKEDHALWDKVANLRYNANLDYLQNTGFYSADDARSGAAKIAFDEADAFMAERAKRMK